MIICSCYNVTDREIEQVIKKGAGSLRKVTEKCKAGSGCGKCKQVIKRMLEEYRSEYDKLPDEEINALVAQRVMNWRFEIDDIYQGWYEQNGDITIWADNPEELDYWNPTYSISLAFEVVDKLRKDGWDLELNETGIESRDVQAVFHCGIEGNYAFRGGFNESRERAICIAALEVMDCIDQQREEEHGNKNT